jgi:hypothetical protein
MTKQECRTVDWRTIGYEDGVAGQPGDRIGAHRRACAEYGIRPDLTAYQAGRAQGLREFCQPHNGYSRGVDGTDYYGDCPADLAAGFEKGYDVGRELYVRQRRVIDTENAMEDRRREIRRLEDRLTESAFDVIDQSATPESRAQGVVDAKQAAERIPRLKKEIAELEKDRVRYQAELDAYRNTVAATY